MTATYNRSEIYSFFDLSDEQKKSLISEYDDADDIQRIENDTYVICKNDILALSMFMRMDNSNVWHGIYGQTSFSAYFIRFNHSNDEALIAYKYFN